MLELMYITNDPNIAEIAQKYGVDRVWIDLETLNKEERQHNLDTVKSRHKLEDIPLLRKVLNKSKLMVRVNPINPNSEAELESVLSCGADYIMLPMWKSLAEVRRFIQLVNHRAKTVLLLETKEAADCIDEVLNFGNFDEIHIGLNDLHLSLGLDFMFELLSDGLVESLCKKISAHNIPYGFGGIARIGEGAVPAEKIIVEHYRLGSTRAILSRSFCDTRSVKDYSEIDALFETNMKKLRGLEKTISKYTDNEYVENKTELYADIKQVVEKLSLRKTQMKIDYDVLNNLTALYGNAFYLLDSKQFEKNYTELKKAFADIYPDFNIAYSYKTNYTPKLCKIVNDLGGYAEIVSDMEMEIALRVGVSPEKIIWNGPYKNSEKVKELLLSGGTVNLDSICELPFIESLAKEFSDKTLNIGVRCNFDIGDGVVSRFGFDVASAEFDNVLNTLAKYDNIDVMGLQCHFATRALDTWKSRVVGMINVLDKHKIVPKHIDLGGGLFGKMHDSLKKQFDSYIPSYREYASEIAYILRDRYNNNDHKPTLLIEPGSALVGDCMLFASRVINIKTYCYAARQHIQYKPYA